MGRIADQLRKALDSKADLKDVLVDKGMPSSTIFESYAEWVRQMRATDKFYIYTLSSDMMMGSVEGSGEYESGTTVTITALPSTGCEFESWQSARGRSYGADNPLTIEVVEADNIIAKFKRSVVYAKYVTVDSLLSEFSEITEELATTSEIFGTNWLKMQTYIAVPEDKTAALSYESGGIATPCILEDFTTEISNIPSGWKVYRYKAISTGPIETTSTKIQIN